MELNQFIDHTALKATTTVAEINNLCREARAYKFYAVCVNSCYVALAKGNLTDTQVKVSAVVGFPLGAMSTAAKIAEAENCIENGADEIDMVVNLGYLKSGKLDEVEKEIAGVKKSIGTAILKVILETCYLSPEEIIDVSKISLKAGADFIKTSTGFGTGGATLDHVKLMKSIAGDKMKIKASGGIKNAATARKYIEAGASRLGTSSGVQIILDQ